MQLSQILIFIKSRNEPVTHSLKFEYTTWAGDSITCLAYPCCTKHSYTVWVWSDEIHTGAKHALSSAQPSMGAGLYLLHLWSEPVFNI